MAFFNKNVYFNYNRILYSAFWLVDDLGDSRD